MKKNIIIIIILLIFTTGCTCEYNLTIDNNNYQEEVRIIAENENEISNYNLEWKIPTDKEENNYGGDPSTVPEYSSDLYEYKLVNNILTFNYNFNKDNYSNSSAVSTCYDTFTVIDYNNATIISTNSKASAFNKYPNLNNITVNIKVDKEVIDHNADRVNGNTYTWYIYKNNADNKSINLTLSNSSNTIDDKTTETPNKSTNSINEENKNENKKTDYTFYIFYGVLLVVMIIVYLIFNKIRNKNNEMDD